MTRDQTSKQKAQAGQNAMKRLAQPIRSYVIVAQVLTFISGVECSDLCRFG